MSKDSQANQELPLAVIGVCVLLTLAAACTTDATPHWASTGFDAGTNAPSVGSNPPDDPDDAGMSSDPGPSPTCSEGKQGFHLDGDHNGGSEPGEDFDLVYPFELHLTEDNSSFWASVLPDGDGIAVSISRDEGGQDWHAIFSTGVDGEQLQPGVYQVDTSDPTHSGPSMDVNGRAENYPAMVDKCAFACGSFEVHEIQVSGASVNRFRATFAQHCRCVTAALRGCVSFRP